jgi:hypothetical protein
LGRCPIWPGGRKRNSPPALVFAFVFIVHEELFKGVALVRLHPIEA